MGNIVLFHKTTPKHSVPPTALAQQFSNQRLPQNSAMWLKENAEFLNVLQSTDVAGAQGVLEFYEEFYAGLDQTFAFFPQYYRFLISIALDLEALGLNGDTAARLIAKANGAQLHAAELSDLQRGEAGRLYGRRDVGLNGNEVVQDRLLAFAYQTEFFAIPNRKIGYELTHIVFYLTNYGAQAFEFKDELWISLKYAGIIAHLQQNYDLLAEIVAALIMAELDVPKAWLQDVEAFRTSFGSQQESSFVGQDAYHSYLMSNWAVLLQGATEFSSAPMGGSAFVAPTRKFDALEQISALLYDQGAMRRTDWTQSGPELMRALPVDVADHLEKVSTSVEEFDAFYDHFARAGSLGNGSPGLRAFN